MINTDLVTVDVSLQVAGAVFLIWLGQKLFDTLLNFLIDKRVFRPVYERILRRLKILKTRGDPVAATFSLSYTPEEDLTITTAMERLKAGFGRAEDLSSGKISIESSHWDKYEREGQVEIQYSDKTEIFTTRIQFVQDTESLRETPSGDPDEVLVGSIGIEVDFNFPFHLLEATLFNLGSLINYLEEGFQDQMRGSFSGGRFVISPVKSDLTIDDWIKEEQFDISLLLATEDDKGTEVEFFSDRAVVKSNRREIDAQTVTYMRELLLNYYL